jgi:hypothetical protein
MKAVRHVLRRAWRARCSNVIMTVLVIGAALFWASTSARAQVSDVVLGEILIPPGILPSPPPPEPPPTQPAIPPAPPPIPDSAAIFKGSIGLIAQQAMQPGLIAVQSQIQNIRDRLQRREAPASPPIAFAAEPTESPDSPWSALAYNAVRDSKSPIFKAPPQPAPAPGPKLGVWGTGYGDWETRRGNFGLIDIGRTGRTGGGIGGVDLTFRNITSATDAFVVGIIGGAMSSRVTNNDGSIAQIDAPSTGVYATYVNGGFSTDVTFKVDFIDVSSRPPGIAETRLHLDNYSTAANLNYKFEFNPSWFEPTVGVVVSRTIWDDESAAQGFTNGRSVRVQGGARYGTSWLWGAVRVEPTVMGLIYSDVTIDGGTLVSIISPLVPTDEGKLFALGNGKINLDFGNGWSANAEGEVRGRTGVLGTAVRGGLRYQF